MRLDRTKLKAAIKQAETTGAARWTWEQRKTLKAGYVKIPRDGSPWLFTASERQILYAISAHSRGRLSMKKMWIPRGGADGGRMLAEFTLEMQAEMIGDAWKEFERPERVQPQVEAPLAAPLSS